MGTGMSKVDNTNLVSLCRERKDLIKAAVGCRYDLASAHVMYFQSLLDVGNALTRFVHEDLFIVSDDNSHLKFSSFDSDSDFLSDLVHHHLDFSGDTDEPSTTNDHPNSQLSASGKHQVEGHHSSSDASSYSEPENEIYIPIIDMRYHPQHGCRVPIRSTMHNSKDNAIHADTDFAHNAPPTPVPAASAWNYFNPFNVEIDNFYSYHSYYSQEDRIHVKTNTDDLNLRKVREKEGIPDLEDEAVQSAVQEKKASDDYAQLVQEKNIESKTDNFEENVRASSDSNESMSEEGKRAMEGIDVSEVDQAFTLDMKSFGPIFLSTHCTRDLREVVKEIEDGFQTAFNYGEQASILLEAGKLPYQPLGARLKVFGPQIVTLVVRSVVMPSLCSAYMLSRRIASKKMKMAKVMSANYEEDVCRKFSNLSSTLEKLYVWEEKLYKEVKGEEKLRVMYDKEWKRLKSLDDRGAEAGKIDRRQASVKRLLSKLNVAVTTVAAISTKIHKLRDEELQYQVNELIEGFYRMWKLVIKCHQKQFQAIIHAKTCIHITGANIQEKSGLKATLKLEKETLNWARCFSHYVKTQKAFVEFLNKWLQRYISHEPEGTLGVVPFSPSKIGAPSTFVVCNDWYNAIWDISEDGLYKAILGFASSLHHLQEKQEEMHKRMKAEHLVHDFSKEFKSLKDASGFPENGVPPLGELSDGLISMRKQLDEQKATYEEAVKVVNGAASNCLRMGLVPLFETLDSFCLENLKAYEKVRIPNRGTSK